MAFELEKDTDPAIPEKKITSPGLGTVDAPVAANLATATGKPGLELGRYGKLTLPEPKPPTSTSLNPKSDQFILGDTLAGDIARAAYDVPVQLTGAAAGFIEGREDPMKEIDWKDRAIERANLRTQRRMEFDFRKDNRLREEIRQLPQNLAFSGVSAALGLGAGIPAAAVGGPGAGYAAGMGAAGLGAYRMEANMFGRELYNAANEDYMEQHGVPIPQDVWSAKFKELQPYITKDALAEAVPEAVGSALGFKILRGPSKAIANAVLGKSVMGKLEKNLTKYATGAVGAIFKGASMFAEEEATEVVTQMLQHNNAIDAGLTEGQKRSWLNPEDVWESAKEVAPQVALLTAVMGGGGAIINRAYQKGVEDPRFLNDVNAVVAEGKLNLMPARVLDQTVQMAEEAQRRNRRNPQFQVAVDSLKAEQTRRQQAAEAAGLPGYGPQQTPPGPPTAPPPPPTTPETPAPEGEAVTPPGPEIPPEAAEQPETPTQAPPPQEIPKNFKEPKTLPGIKVTEAYRAADEAIANGAYEKLGEIATQMDEYSQVAKSNRVKEQAKDAAAQIRAYQIPEGTTPAPVETPPAQAGATEAPESLEQKDTTPQVEETTPETPPVTEFTPTHELPDGTQVAPNIKEGEPVENEWVDAEGTVIEDQNAEPLTQPEITPETQPETEQVTPQVTEKPEETTTAATPETPAETKPSSEGEIEPELKTPEEQQIEETTPITDEDMADISDDDIEKMFQDAEAQIQAAADEAATSPTNDKPEPTPEQMESGKYDKGKIPPELVNNHTILIENPAGSVRKGTDQDGETWEQTMKDNYGYFDHTEAADGDDVDVFVGPKAVDPTQDVYVVNQMDPKTGEFDEHKVMYGYESQAAAEEAYKRNYADDWQGMGQVDTYTQADFKKKLESGFFKNSTVGKMKPPAPRAEPVEEGIGFNVIKTTREGKEYPTYAIREEEIPARKMQAWEAYKADNKEAVEKLEGYEERWSRGFDAGLNAEGEEKADVVPYPQGFFQGQQAREDLLAGQGITPPEVTTGQIQPPAKETPPKNKVPTFNEFYDQWTQGAQPPHHESDTAYVVTGFNNEPNIWHTEPSKHGLVGKQMTLKEAIRQRYDWILKQKNLTEPLDQKEFEAARQKNRDKFVTDIKPKLDEFYSAVRTITPERLEKANIKKKGQTATQWLMEIMNRKTVWGEGGRKISGTGIQMLQQKNLWPTDDGSGETLRKAMLKAIQAIRKGPGYSEDWLSNIEQGLDPFTGEKVTVPVTEPETTKKKPTTQKEELVEASKKALDAKVTSGAAKGIKVKPYRAGWEHAVTGGTMSNMSDVSDAKKEGYDAAVEWMKEKGYKPKIDTVYEDTGAVLRRIHDGIKSNVNQADNKLVELYKQTNRQNLLPDIVAHDKATPGVRQLLWDIRNSLYPFKEWAGEKYGASRRRWGRNHGEAVEETFEENPQEVLKDAEEYADILREIGELFYNEPALEPLLKKIENAWFTKTEAESFGRKYYRYKDTEKGERANDVLRKGNWRFRYEYTAKRLKTENMPFDPNAQRKIPMRRPKMDSIERSGFKTDRNGRNITREEIRETFGLSNLDGKLTDVTLGEYVKKDKRAAQDHLNYAYDAMHDLAETLGIKPKDIGMGGYWHLSIGALGQGHHAAHFNPGHPVDLKDGTKTTTAVINITKGKGDGSLAHEWGHALDYKLRNSNPAGVQYVVGQLKRQALEFDKVMEDVQRFITGGWRYPHLDKKRAGGRKPWWDHALHHVKYRLKMADDTQYYKNAKKMDGSKAGGMQAYWSNDQELFARAFEGHVFDIMPGESNYLVNEWVEAGRIAPPRYKGQPYPAEEDRASASNNMELLLKAIKWTKDGPVLSKDWKAPETTYDTDGMRKKVIAKIEEIRQEQEKALEQKVKDKEIGLTGGTELAKEFYRAINEGNMPKDNRELKKFIAKYDGVDPKEIDAPRMKTAQEDLEAAIVMRGRWIMEQIVNHRKRYGSDEMSDREAFNALRSLYESQPLLNIQTTDSKSRQAFSTPLPMAYIASRLAGINRESFVYEPTAGNGALLIDANHSRTRANELDEVRRNALKSMFSEMRTSQNDATTYVPTGRHDVVITNPPFGKLDEMVDVDGYEISKIDHLIAANSLQAMEDNGRAVLIIGANKKAGGITNADRVFFNWLYSNYKVTQHFEVSGDLYTRQGAGWPVRMIVIEGRQESKTFSPLEGDIKRINSYEGLYKTFAAIRDGQDVVSVIERESGQGAAGGKVSPQEQGTESGGLPGTGMVEPGGTVPQGATTPGSGGTGGRGPGTGGYTGRPDVTGYEDTGVTGPGETGTATGEQRGAGAGTGQVETGVQEADTGLPPETDLSISDEDFEKLLGDVEQGTGQTVESKIEYPKTGDTVGPHVVTEQNPEYRNKEAQEKRKEFDEKTAGEHIAEAGKNVVNSVDAALEGLTELFGGKSTLKSFPAFDEETYQKALPHFERSMDEAKKAAKNINQAWKIFIDRAVAKFGPVIIPYIKRFRNEYYNREKGLQAAYSGMSKSPSGTVLTPINQATATFRILKKLNDEYGSVDEFVRKELQYDSIEEMWGEEGSRLAGLQIDGIALAIYQIKNGGALVIGDQTGVGKGRQAAGMIRWARINGYTPVFVTQKPDLFTDMYEELHAIGETDAQPFLTGNSKGHWIVDHSNNNELIYRNTSGYRSNVENLIQKGELPEGRNMLFTTYDQMNSKGDRPTPKREMLAAVADNALFILDEAHEASGNNPAAVAHRGLFFRSMLERSGRAVYLSATYAKRPDNMFLYFLTDLSKAADSMTDLIAALNAGGVPLMEIVSTQLTASGQFIRRERSFEGISTTKIVDPDPDDKSEAAENLRKKDVRSSDEVTARLRQIILADRAFNSVVPDIRRRMLTEMGVDVRPGGNQAGASVNHASFTSVIHNAIAQMLVSIKADRAAERAIDDLKANKRPIIAIDKTMGSFLDDHASWVGARNGDQLPGFDYRVVLTRALRRTRYVSVKSNRTQRKPDRVEVPIEDLPPAIQEIYRSTQQMINELDVDIPASPLDRIRYRLEQAGYSVAEITGRTKIAKYHEDGTVTLDTKPLRERNDRVGIVQAFNDGDIDVILANRAASTGISMHAKPTWKPPKGQWQRKMTVVDASSDIAKFMQMLGRINRTGQVVVPEYELHTTSLMAEKRISSLLMGKLKKMNANTSSNEKSTQTFEGIDLINKYGDEIIARYLDDTPEVREFIDVNYNLSSDPIQVDGVAQTVTGQMAVMPHYLQEEFYNRVEPEYEAHIKYLDSINKNDLKAKTHQLDARLIEDPVVIHQGDDQSSMFTSDAVLGKYSVLRETKVPTPQQVQHELNTELGERTPEQYMNELLEPAAAAYGPIEDEYVDKLRKAYEDMKDDNPDKAQTARGNSPIPQPQTGAGKAYNTRYNMLDRLRQSRSQVVDRMMRRYKIGNGVTLDLGDGDIQGVVMGVKHEWTEGETGNPYAKSRWKVDIRINGYSGRINQPLSRFEVIDPVENYEGERGRPANLNRIFEQTIENTSERDIRYIVTGNIIGAHRNLNRSGEIAHFTMAGEKNPVDGIIMPRDFDPAVDVNQETLFRDPATAYRFLKDNLDDDVVSSFGLKTGDGSLRAMPINSQGDIELWVKGQGIGNKWWQNTEFVSLISGSPEGFAGNKDSKRITVPAADVPAVFDYIYRTSPLYALQSLKDKAKPYVTDVDLNAPRFAVGAQETGNLGVRAVTDHAQKLMSDWVNRPDTRVVRTESVLPDEIQAHIKKVGAEGTVEGVYWKGKAYVVADKMKDMDHVERVISEEVLGHHGLRSILGPKFTPIMNEVWMKYGKRGTQDVINRYFTGENTFDVNNRDHRLLVAEEKLTDMIQEDSVPPSIWKRIIAALRSWWRENVFSLQMSDNDIKVLLQNAKDFVKNGNLVKRKQLSTLPAVYSRAKEELLKTKFWTENRIEDPEERENEVVSAFDDVGATQRGAPEAAMLKFTRWYGGGVIAPAVEHAGDLTHRMTAAYPYSNYGYEYVKEKVDKLDRWLNSGYGFDRENEENIKSNAEYSKTPLAEYRKKYDALLKNYAEEHKKLNVYNDIQFTARQLAISLGEQDFYMAKVYIRALKRIVDDKEKYIKEAGKYYLAERGGLVTFDWNMSSQLRDAKKEAKKQQESGQAPDTPMFSRSPSYATYDPEVQAAKDRAKFGRDDVDKPLLRALGRAKDAIDEGRQVWKTRLRQGMLDQYDSLRTTLDNPRAWMMANLSHSAGGAVEALLKYGRIYLKENAIGVDTKKKSLAQVFEPLGDEVADFLQWVAANRSNRLIREGKESLLSQKQIDALLTLNDSNRIGNTALDGKDREKIYREAAKQLDVINDSVVQIGVDTGTISSDDADIWRSQGFYVPFYRLIEKQGTDGGGFMSVSGLVNQTPFKELKGAEIPLNDLVTNMVMNWNHVLSASLKNQAAVETIETAMEMGLAAPANPKYHSKKAFFIREDGKKKWYEMDESSEGQLVLDSLMSLNWRGLDNLTMKIARKFKRALTMGVTASPEFKVANLLRDSIQAVAVANVDPKLWTNIIQGWKATAKNNEIYAQMIAGGGAFGDSGYVYGSDQEAIQKVLKRDLTAKNRILDHPNKIKAMWDLWADLGARAENVNRAANFEQDISREDGKVDLLTANFHARDHLDFMRTGSFTAVRALTQVIPFLNARMQGLDKLARAAADPQQKAQFYTTVAVYGLASVLMYLWMKDDDDYKEAPQWERDTYHLFKIPGSDLMFRIPRPFEVGFMATMMERFVEQMVDDEVHGGLFWDRLWHGVHETLAFNPIPQVIAPAIEVASNKSFFTQRPIENVGMQNLSPENRKRAWTSETAIGLSRAYNAVVWEKAELSPVQVEHLVNGYLGWAGGFMLSSSDLIYRGLTGAPEAPTRRVQDYIAIGRFARRGPPWSTQYTTTFYENLQDVNRAYNDIRWARQHKELEQVESLIQENRQKLVWRKVYNKAQRELTELNKNLNLVRDNPDMSGAEKRKKMDALLIRKARITHSIVKRSNDDFL